LLPGDVRINQRDYFRSMSVEPNFTINAYKRKFDRELRDIKVMMMSHKNSMTKHAWIRLVMATKKSIMANPENFFRNVPEPHILKEALDKVFQGFLDDQKIRDAQRRL
jgi:hypothetical protein